MLRILQALSPRALNRIMQTGLSTDVEGTTKDHLTVTSNQSRDSATHEVIVTKMSDMSSTVKHLTLYTPKRPIPFTFKSGQWIDMFIPGVDQVGGFSITSSPTHLRSTGELYLAIKNSDSAPSNWVHTQCKKGNTVSIRVGGDFFLNLSNLKSNSNSRILFIAGGVGINPLASMIAELKDMNFTIDEGKPMQISLLFSAKTHQELIFRKEFDAIQSTGFKSHYFVTGMKDYPNEESCQVKYRRIMLEDIQHITKDDTLSEVRVYLCGPSDMINNFQNVLTSLGVKHIYFEKWW